MLPTKSSICKYTQIHKKFQYIALGNFLLSLKMNSQLSRGMHTKKLKQKSEKKNNILETDHPRALKLQKFLFFLGFLIGKLFP